MDLNKKVKVIKPCSFCRLLPRSCYKCRGTKKIITYESLGLCIGGEFSGELKNASVLPESYTKYNRSYLEADKKVVKVVFVHKEWVGDE